MKRIFNLILIPFVLTLTSCELDLIPKTSYNEGNVELESTDPDASPYNTREDIKGLRDAMYTSKSWVFDIQKVLQDWMVYAECRVDNAYCGNPSTGGIVSIEQNSQDGGNNFVTKDWSWYLNQVSNCNNIICNIDRVKEADPSMTDQEHDEWLSEALCWRAWNLFQMVQLWGDVPFVTSIPPAINSENVSDVYELYFPKRTPQKDVVAQLIKDLEYAAENAPEKNDKNKFLFTKGFAHGMLARIYSWPLYRDWNKVKAHCEAIEAMGYELNEDYGYMWSYTPSDSIRNTKESIFEVTYSKSRGHWLWMMFHRNAYKPNANWDWIKWCTPSRDLIAAYENAGDTERANASIIYDQCGWEQYYPKDKYPFIHKLPTNCTSFILMRLGEIYLLHAEALAGTGDLAGATAYVNKVRQRAGLKNIDVPADYDTMVKLILDERRLELAFEGFRFFDLARYGLDKVVEKQMEVVKGDDHWFPRTQMTEETLLLPIPQSAMDKNTNLVNNPGY